MGRLGGSASDPPLPRVALDPFGSGSTRDSVELSLFRGSWPEFVGEGSCMEGGRGGREGGAAFGPHLDNSGMHSLCIAR